MYADTNAIVHLATIDLAGPALCNFARSDSIFEEGQGAEDSRWSLNASFMGELLLLAVFRMQDSLKMLV